MHKLLLFFIIFSNVLTAQSLKRQTLGVIGTSTLVNMNTKSYFLQQSIGQNSVIGSFEKDNIRLQQGFIQPLQAIFFKEGKPNELEVIVYPNPFVNGVVVIINDALEEQIAMYLFDIQGRLLVQDNYETSNQLVIPLDFLSQGAYFLRLQSGQKQQTVQLLKQ